jgi:sugar phosphate isomerase/epimerase
MKLSVTIWSMHNYIGKDEMDVKGFIEYCASIGSPGVDLGYFWKDEATEIPQAMEWLKASNVQLGAYISRGDFTKQDAAERAQEVETLKKAVDAAAMMNAPALRVFAGNGWKGATFADVGDWVIEGHKQVAAYAEEKGVIVGLENHGRLCGTIEAIRTIVDGVGSDNFGVTFDTGNWVGAGEDPVEAAREFAKDTVYVHIKDLKKGEERSRSCVVGEGFVDIAGCGRILKDAGYQGWYSLEYEAAEDEKVGVPASLEAMKRLLAGIA